MIRFAAFADVHVLSHDRGRKLRDVMQKTLEKYDISAFLFAGDLTDAQNSSRVSTVGQMAYFAEYAAEGNTKDLPIVWTLGNHDFPLHVLENDMAFSSAHWQRSYSFSKGMTAYDTAMEICTSSSSAFVSQDAWPVAGEVPDGLRYNCVEGYSFVAVDYTHVTADSMAWLKTRLDAITEKEPNKPIFLTSHMPDGDVEQPEALSALLKLYPQMVYVSGHTHTPYQTYSSFAERDGFVEINIGPGNHGCYGVEVPAPTYYSYQMKQGAIIEVDGDGNLRVMGLDFSFEENEDGSVTSTLGESNVVVDDPMVIRTAHFSAPTAAARGKKLFDSVVDSKEDPRYFDVHFAQGTAAVFENLSANGATVTFDAPRAANVVERYAIELEDKTTGEMLAIYDALADKNGKTPYVTALQYPGYFILYPTSAHQPKKVTFVLKTEAALDPTHDYALYIRATDDFGVDTARYAFAFHVKGERVESVGRAPLS